jgi:hypothetical protein
MSTLNYTVIDGNNDVDDSTVEPDTGSGVPGNALRVFQFNDAASTESQLLLASSGSADQTSSEGLVFVGQPTNMAWVELEDRNSNVGVDTGSPTASDNSERVNIDGAIRGRGFLDESGRDLVELVDNLLPNAPELQTFDFADGNPGKIGANTASFGFSQNDVVAVQSNTQDPAELGVFDDGSTVTGDLNFNVSGTSVYSDDAFGPGDRGHLELVINGVRPTGTEDGDNTNDDSTYFDLTDLSAGNTTAGSTTSGFIMDAAQNISFPNGQTFSDGYQRTGQFFVEFADLADNDVNEIEVRHYVDGSLRASTNTIYVFKDADGSSITFTTTNSGADPAIDGSPTLNSTRKFLSGIEYAVGAQASLNYVANGVYRTSYSASGSGINFQTTNCELTDTAIPDNSDVADQLLVADQSPGTGQTRPASSESWIARAGNDPDGFGDGPDLVIDDDFSVQLFVEDPVEGTATPGSVSGGYSLLVDNEFQQSNWETREDFIIEGENQGTGGSEGTRVQEANVSFSGDVSDGNLGAGRFDPTTDISDDSSNSDYANELQVFDRQLVYPSRNFSTGFQPTTSTGDYSGSQSTGVRQYVGFAEDTSDNIKDFALRVNGSGTLVEAGTLTTGSDEVSIELRIGGQNDTGWLDVTIAESDSGGCFASTNGNSQSLDGNDIGIIMDAFSNEDGAGGRLFYRIRYPENGTATIDNVEVEYLS